MKLEHTLPDALADALGQIVAQVRREWMAELEHIKAERRALVAELRLAALGEATPAPTPAPVAKGGKPKSGSSS